MITMDMRDDSQFATIIKNRVARHMHEMRLCCKTTKKFVVTTDSKHFEPTSSCPNYKYRLGKWHHVYKGRPKMALFVSIHKPFFTDYCGL